MPFPNLFLTNNSTKFKYFIRSYLSVILMEYKGQGAIEYLLLLAAAVVVVAVVVSFMISTIQPVIGGGSQQTYDYTCKTLNTNSFMCGCYECNAKKGGVSEVNGGLIKMTNQTDCNALSELKGDSLLSGTKCGASIPAN